MRYILLAPILVGAFLSSTVGLGGPECAGPSEIVRASALRLDRNGSLVLSDGRVLHLEGIRLPTGKPDRAPQSFADEARAAITGMVKTAQLTVSSLPPRIDRHNRLRVQAFAGSSWIQMVLVARGLARVSIAPDRTECATELFAAEAQARAAGRGVWAAPAYAVRSPSTVRNDAGTFQIVEGRVVNASVKSGRAYLNFGKDWRTDFTVTVDPVDMPNFRSLGVDPKSYVGQAIRVRGWVQWHNGPEIEVANPQSVEVLP